MWRLLFVLDTSSSCVVTLEVAALQKERVSIRSRRTCHITLGKHLLSFPQVQQCHSLQTHMLPTGYVDSILLIVQSIGRIETPACHSIHLGQCLLAGHALWCFSCRNWHYYSCFLEQGDQPHSERTLSSLRRVFCCFNIRLLVAPCYEEIIWCLHCQLYGQ